MLMMAEMRSQVLCLMMASARWPSMSLCGPVGPALTQCKLHSRTTTRATMRTSDALLATATAFAIATAMATAPPTPVMMAALAHATHA